MASTSGNRILYLSHQGLLREINDPLQLGKWQLPTFRRRYEKSNFFYFFFLWANSFSNVGRIYIGNFLPYIDCFVNPFFLDLRQGSMFLLLSFVGSLLILILHGRGQTKPPHTLGSQLKGDDLKKVNFLLKHQLITEFSKNLINCKSSN